MENCCADKACSIERLRNRQARTLRLVLVVNASMFVIEFATGLAAGSVALVADSLDMLGDALVYGFSLYVVARSPVWKARAAVLKAALMALFGLAVLGELAYKFLFPQPPLVEAMGAIGMLALAANGWCFGLLWRHRAEDINMRSVWLCSRNDLIANVSVLVAAAGVFATGSPWPDVIVGALICAVFLRSAVAVAREAGAELGMNHAGLFRSSASRPNKP